MLRVPKTTSVRLDKDNRKRHAYADETQSLDSQPLSCFMASFLCLKISRQSRGESPKIYQIGLDCQGNTDIFSLVLVSFLRVIVGLFFWQNYIKHFLLLIKWLSMRPLSFMKKDEGHMYMLNKWINSLIQDQYVWWLTGPLTLREYLSSLVLRRFLCPDILEFFISPNFLILSILFNSSSSLQWCVDVTWCLW